MEVQNKNGNGNQKSLFSTNLKKNPSQKEKEYIIKVFNTEHENTLKRISQITGFTKGSIDAVLNKYLDTKLPKRKVKFAGSKYDSYNEVKAYINSNDEFKRRYGKADIPYYLEAVRVFSEKKEGIFRTDDGWKATIRQFMNSDIKSGKLALTNISSTKERKTGAHQNF